VGSGECDVKGVSEDVSWLAARESVCKWSKLVERESVCCARRFFKSGGGQRSRSLVEEGATAFVDSRKEQRGSYRVSIERRQ
jgi:hypothetical protein